MTVVNSWPDTIIRMRKSSDDQIAIGSTATCIATLAPSTMSGTTTLGAIRAASPRPVMNERGGIGAIENALLDALG